MPGVCYLCYNVCNMPGSAGVGACSEATSLGDAFQSLTNGHVLCEVLSRKYRVLRSRMLLLHSVRITQYSLLYKET